MNASRFGPTAQRRPRNSPFELMRGIHLRQLIPLLIVFVIAALLLNVVRINHAERVEGIREAYLSERRDEAKQVADRVRTVFRDVYQGLRTVARLPGVRGIEPNNGMLTDDARQAVQEIYNNLASNVDLSEVYLLPRQFDPDRLDPHTGRLYDVIATFDEFIIGRTAEDAERRSPPVSLPEVEIYEYRLMRQQIHELELRYPNLNTIKGLRYPAIGGPEVLTCDNRRVSPSEPDDALRSGLVYSVPIYNLEGELSGLVSGVLLTPILGELLPNGDYALVHPADGFEVQAPDSGQARRSSSYVRRAVADDGLTFSTVIPIGTADIAAPGWLLWAGHANEDFESLPELVVTHRLYHASLGLVIGISLVVFIYLSLLERNRLHLEARIRARTRALSRANAQLQESRERERRFTGDVAHELRTPIAGIRAQTERALRESNPESARSSFTRILEGVDRATRVIEQLMDLARLEPEAMRARYITVDLTRIVRECVSALAPEASAAGVALHPAELQPLMVHGDSTTVLLMLRNLVENAVHCTPTGSQVNISITRHGEEVWMSVYDRGPGIPRVLRGQVKNRFFQVTSGAGQGIGLGLSIVERIAHLHNARVEFHDREPGPGTEARVVFEGEVTRED